MKKLLIILTIVLLTFVGCNNENEKKISENSDESSAVVYMDALDREVTIDSQPKRVVSLYASFGDLWYEAGGELVGIIEASTIPEKAKDLPRVGSMSTPNVEAILALDPDLVIIRAGYSAHEALLEILEQSNITVYAANYNSFEETMKTFKDFASINNENALYEEKSGLMIKAIEALKSEGNSFDYLLLFASSKSISTKDDNISARIIDDLGGENITKSYQIADETTKQFSFEKILEADPEYIFVQTMGDIDKAKARIQEDIASNPAWASLTAVKEGRFIYLPKELFLYKPNMKYLEAYEYIQNILAE